MDDTRNDLTPHDVPRPENHDQQSNNPPAEPRWTIDVNGNVVGPIFSFPSEHMMMFDDVAITDPVELAKLRKPKPDA
jgi:hypothetical protein